VSTSRFVLPETALKGKARIWTDPVVADITRRMHEGDATLGWEGDERLGLYITEDNRWLVVRHEYTIVRSKPGASLIGLIPALAEGDQRRRNATSIVAAFDAADRESESQERQKIAEAAEAFLQRSYRSPASRKP
jgi:hypothetical protein